MVFHVNPVAYWVTWCAAGLLAGASLGACSSNDSNAKQFSNVWHAYDSGTPFANDGAVPQLDSGSHGGWTGLPPIQQSDAGSGGNPLDGGQNDASSSSDAGRDSDSGPSNPLAKYGLEPFVTNGTPISAPNLTWTWIDFPDTKCRDGSAAGIAVSLNSASQDLMIFLEGGGACFDDVTCGANPGNVSSQKGEKKDGIFNRDWAENPVKDWNYVYVPYCTGDIHAGAKPDSDVSTFYPKQQFVGYLNLQSYLQRVVPTFPNPTRVLLTGISAGGFGAATTAVLVQRAFYKNKVILIDDSGPPQSSAVVPPCLQTKMVNLWGFENSILKDCGTHCPDHSAFMQDFGVFLVKTFSDRLSGLIEANNDSIRRASSGPGITTAPARPSSTRSRPTCLPRACSTSVRP